MIPHRFAVAGLALFISFAVAPPAARAQATTSIEKCRDEADKWSRSVHALAHGQPYTAIAFLDTGEVCWANRLFGVEGDPIHVAVLTAIGTTWNTRFEPCSVEPAAPAVLVSAESVKVAKVAEGGPTPSGVELRPSVPRRCFNEAVAIRFSESGGGGHDFTFNLSQSRRYRATIQLGTVFTTAHDEKFVLRDQGGTSVIASEGPAGRGVEYTANLVLYGVLNYLPPLFGSGSYSGRDIVHEQGFADRLGAVLGVGLSDPTRRFVAGATFEIIYGVNLLAVNELALTRVLDGVSVGQALPAGAIPTKQVWDNRFVLGLSIDLVYVRELFGGHVSM